MTFYSNSSIWDGGGSGGELEGVGGQFGLDFGPGMREDRDCKLGNLIERRH